jgi:hypothetical protein
MAEQDTLHHATEQAWAFCAPAPQPRPASARRPEAATPLHLPERRLASHLFLACTPAQAADTEQRMRSLYQRLLIDIRRFPRLAQRHSDGPHAAEGGALGWVTRGMLPACLERVLFALDADTLSPVFRSPDGFHVIYCSGIRPHGVWLPEQA